MQKYLQIFTLIIISTFFLSNCKSASDKDIRLIASYKLQLPEPSGLTLSFDKEFLWTVSDENSTVYKISKTGSIIDSFIVDGFDLEGINVMGDDQLSVVLERTRELVYLKNNGDEIWRKKINITGEENAGLEGITLREKNNHTFLLNEKKPGALLELDKEMNLVKTTELKWGSDFSGIFYETNEDVLWIISDESQLIAKCSLEGEVMEKYKVELPQIEGIAVDAEDHKIYIVSDKSGYLYVFAINN